MPGHTATSHGFVRFGFSGMMFILWSQNRANCAPMPAPSSAQSKRVARRTPPCLAMPKCLVGAYQRHHRGGSAIGHAGAGRQAGLVSQTLNNVLGLYIVGRRILSDAGLELLLHRLHRAAQLEVLVRSDLAAIAGSQ